jgi:predicted GIY-YIG superfamily endonuclease
MPPRTPSGRFMPTQSPAFSAAGAGIQHEVGIKRLSAEYLLHFERPYRHARHYLGFAEDLERRLELHRAGRGARLVEVVVAAGIGFQLVRTWEGDRTLERTLKNRHNAPARLCPLCRAERRAMG